MSWALLLNPKVWLALALAAFLSASHLTAYRAGKSVVRADFDAYRAAQAEQRIFADRARTLATTQALNDAHDETNAADAAAADADDARERLRARLATVLAKQQPTARPGPSQQGGDPLDVLANVLNRHDDALQRVAEYADRLKIAGLACERISDGLEAVK